MSKISVIIPTYNEAECIYKLLHFLKKYGEDQIREIIVSDGGSEDHTLQVASEAGAVTVKSPNKGRSAQMNYGASLATGEVLYFVHADTLPPVSFTTDILSAVQTGYSFGRYRTRFDSTKKILLFNAWFTRFDLFICYGGDQTLFITKKLFEELQGFNVEMRIMEDYDIVTRAKSIGARYKIFSSAALVSARKYETNSWLRVQTANYEIIRMYKKGASQNDMVQRYKGLLNYR